MANFRRALLFGSLHFRGITGHCLGGFVDDDGARFIHEVACIHPGTILWIEYFLDTLGEPRDGGIDLQLTSTG